MVVGTATESPNKQCVILTKSGGAAYVCLGQSIGATCALKTTAASKLDLSDTLHYASDRSHADNNLEMLWSSTVSAKAVTGMKLSEGRVGKRKKRPLKSQIPNPTGITEKSRDSL